MVRAALQRESRRDDVVHSAHLLFLIVGLRTKGRESGSEDVQHRTLTQLTGEGL